MGFVNRAWLLLAILLASVSALWGQRDFIQTSNPITSAVLRADQQEIAFTDQQNIYLLDVPSFSIRDTIPVEQIPQFAIESLKYVESNPDALMAKYKELSPYGSYRLSFDFLEYPQDSVFVYDLQTGKTRDRKLPGNVFLSFATDREHYLFAYNQWFEYEDPQGQLMRGSQPGELVYYPEKVTVPASGIVRNLQVAPANDRAAIVYYDNSKKSGDSLRFKLEIRDLPNLQVQNELPIASVPQSMEFSGDGTHLALVMNPSSTDWPKEAIAVYRTDDLVRVYNLDEEIRIGHRIYGNTAWVLNDSEVKEVNLENETRGAQIWSNLTPFNQIRGFFKINENDILLYGGSPYSSLDSGAKNGIYKYSLKDNAIYSGAEVFRERDTLFDPSEVRIQNNQFLGGKIQTTQDGKRLIAATGDWLHWWDLSSQFKLREVHLENAIIGMFPGRDSEVLIFESANQKSYSDFNIRLLNLDTGVILGKACRENSGDVPDPGGSAFSCSQLADGSWICNDSDARIWEIRPQEGDWQLQELLSSNDEAFDRSELLNFQYHAGTGTFAYNQTDWKQRSNFEAYDIRIGPITFWDPESRIPMVIPNSEGIQRFELLENGELAFQDGKALKIMNRSGISRIILKLGNEDLLETLSSKDMSYFLLQDTSGWADSITVVAYATTSGQLLPAFKLPTASSYFLTPDGLGYSDQELLYTYDPKTRKHISWDTSKSLYTSDADMSLSDDGQLLFRNRDLIDLARLEIENKVPSYFNAQLLRGDLSGKVLLMQKSIWGEETPTLKFSIADPDTPDTAIWSSEAFDLPKGSASSEPSKTVRSAAGNYAVAYNNLSLLEAASELFLIDIKGRNVIRKIFDFPFDEAYFMGNERYLALYEKPSLFNDKGGLLGDNEKTHILSLPSLELRYTLPGKVDVHLEGDQFLGTALQDIRKIDAASGEETNFYAREVLKRSFYLRKEDLYVAGSTDGALIVWKPDTQSPIEIIRLGNSEIIDFQRSDDKLYVLLAGSQIRVVDIPSLELEVGLDFSEDEEENTSLVWLSPEGYFKASKQDIRKYHFVRGSEAFPLLSYELFLNRPDLLLSKLGHAPQETIDIYKEAYLKRLRRNGFKAPSDYLALERPELHLQNRESIPLVSPEAELQLSIGVSPAVHQVKVYINGVPVATFDPDPGTSTVDGHITLNPGLNAITILGKSAEGIESDPLAFEITNAAPTAAGRIIYLGVGVSHYADTTMNLRYADKDVRRIAEVLSQLYGDRLQVDTLLNESVSRESLKKLKDRLLQTDINDIVILSFSGHGLVDEESEFYFATHDIDFKNPSRLGFSYDEMQHLLDGIPARRKLLLLDACNSGEIDSEEDLQTVALPNQNVTQHLPEGSRGSGVLQTKKNQGLQSSFELMRSLFYDLDRGNGSYVISAAGGREFAYESEAWGNGVFTYSFLNALYDLSDLRVSELRNYIYQKVTELTGGNQKPTSRSENLEWDWELK